MRSPIISAANAVAETPSIPNKENNVSALKPKTGVGLISILRDLAEENVAARNDQVQQCT